MKKLFLSLIVAVCSLAASAQVYVGGQVGLWRNTDDNHTSFNLAPELGYKLSDQWDLGLSIGFAHEYYKGVKLNGFEVDPYVRYTVAKAGPVSFFIDGGAGLAGGFGFATAKAKYRDWKSDSFNQWQIGIKPGVKVSLSKKVDFIASMGFLGYRDNDDVKVTGIGGLDDFVEDAIPSVYGEKGFGFDFKTSNLKFGLIYNF